VLIQTRTALTPAAPTAPAISAPAPAQTYAIKAGDTFSSIASAQFGDEKYWTAIAQANPLVDPTRLKIGQVIRLPDLKSFAQQRDQQLQQIRSVVGTGQRDGEVLVQPGDTLSHIADRVYGKSSLWPVIFRANRDILEGPDDVKPGMKLRIPPRPGDAVKSQ
jgi:nucleoid-associated protein YgaU